jgi:LysM repeat protein
LTVDLAAPTRPRRRLSHFLAPLALAGLVAAVVLVVTHTPHTVGTHNPAHARHARVRRLPPYWTVKPGDTLTHIARRTGLSLAQLEAYNPNTDPQSLVPGERLRLTAHLPRHHPKPLGPRYWTVRPGESFGSIAAKTHIDITKLEQLNSQLKPATLQPGDRVRLRH